jgi:succinate dehydrogenase hydrophobic anchor subunit
MMIRSTASRTFVQRSVRHLSNKRNVGFLESDAGPLGTHIHHAMTSFLCFATPAYFLLPSNNFVDKAFGSIISVTIAGHSWVALNYIAADYVQKVNIKYLPAVRVFNFSLGLVTLLGLGAISFNGKGGIKGAVTALWTKKEKTPEKA